jgi:hypothetical protein
VRSPRPNREVFRLAPPVVLWWVWLAFAAANVADFVIQGASARFAIVVCAILATITGLAYALALRPRVIAEPSGLTIVNPFRDHHVPWTAIQAVDTGDWVRVHYAASAAGPGAAAGPPGISSAGSKVISCWALYISAGAKRKAARAAPAAAPGFARLPEEAKYLASLPAAKAIAVSLDTRADRERARLGQARAAQASPTQASTAQTGAAQASATQADPARAMPTSPVTARWAWPPVAAVAVPLLALLIILLI